MCHISRVSGLKYHHPEEAVLHHSSPASHFEFSRPKLAVSYRRSRVSEIEYYHPLDAVLFLAGSFDHARPLFKVKYYHTEEAISYSSSRVS